MSTDSLKYFKIAKKLNEELKKDPSARKLHFRGNIGSFSLISLDRETPEQGKGGFKDEKKGWNFYKNEIDALLATKKEKIRCGESRPTREKELQAWIINYAINNEYQLPFASGLKFLTSELAFHTPEKIVNDILAIDDQGSLVVIELKSTRHKTTLEGQIDAFCDVIVDKKDFFKELIALLAPQRAWNGCVRKMIVWPDANGKTRSDWNDIEEIRYKEKIGSDGPLIDYNNKGEIIFL